MRWRPLALLGLLGCGGGAGVMDAAQAPDAVSPPDAATAPDAPPAAEVAPLAAVVVRPPSDRSLQDIDCALGPGGDGIVVWRETDADFRSQVWSSRLPPDQRAWQAPLAIGARPAGQVDGPFVTIDDRGRALAVWNETGAADPGVVGARGLPASGWEAPAVISASGWVTALVGEATGEAVAFGVVEGKPPTLLRHSPDGGWSPDPMLRLERDGSFFASSSGAALLAWSAPAAAGQELFTSDYLPSTGWTAPARLQEARPLDSPLPILNGALTPDGTGLLLWNRGGEVRGELWVAARASGMPWEPPRLLTDGAAPLWTTEVAAAGIDGAVVVWETGDGPRRTVNAAVRTGGAWQPSAILGTGSELTAGAVAATGAAVVAWSTPGGVFARRYTPGRGWSATSAWPDDFAGVASLCTAIDATGRAWIVWVGESPQVVRAAAEPR
jgi:hypothetical protein